MRQLLSRLFRRQPSALILLYHRVADVRPDPQLLAVTPSHFAEQLDVLRTTTLPTPLSRLADAPDSRRDASLPTVALTFDDGYADNLINAKPLLERHDVPATVFVATGQTGRTDEFWWDELERLLLTSGDAQSHDSWNVLSAADPTASHSKYRRVFDQLRALPHAERQPKLQSLRESVGDPGQGRATHRVMTAGEISRLEDGGLVEVGAHTLTHPVLSALPIADQRREVVESKAALDGMLGRSTTSFSYPYGTRADYTADTVSAVRDAGFSLACSNFVGVVDSRADRFQLPRVIVRDWDGDEFARQLRSWLAR